jgi:hypothetical protein
MAPSRRHRIDVREEDLQILEPILLAGRDAILRSGWKLGDPIENLSGFITLVVIAQITRQLKEIGVIREEPTNGPDDCGFYSDC